MNEEEIAAQKRIEELEKQFETLSAEIFFAWDSWQYQKSKVEDLKSDRQNTRTAEEELTKREKIYSNRKIKIETRQQEIEREIKKLNQEFPNLQEAIQKEKKEIEKKARDKSRVEFNKSLGILSALSIGLYGAYTLAADRLQIPIGFYEGGMPQNLLKNRPDPVVPIIRKYNIKKPKWRGLRTLNSCTKLKSIELIAWRKYNQIGIKSKEEEKELDKLYVWGYWLGCTPERYG